MTDWKYIVYLADLHDQFEEENNDKIDIKKVVTTIHDRLVLLKNVVLEEDDDADYIIDGPSGLDYLIDEFTYFDFSESQKEQLKRSNDLINEMYDFADWNFIWINTFDVNMDGIGKP